MEKVALFWFRRDLRLEDNTALNHCLKENPNVIPLFIFDEEILNELPHDDPRVGFIHESLNKINQELNSKGTSLLVVKGKTFNLWEKLIKSFSISRVYVNKDYEPYAKKRDLEIESLLNKNNISLVLHKDQVVHEENEILKNNGTPYTVFTPYKRKWLENYKPILPTLIPGFNHFQKEIRPFPSLKELGFSKSKIKVKPYNLSQLKDYANTRDFPSLDTTSYLSVHLRFGTVSIRSIISKLQSDEEVFLSELIWREFFMQILFHFPKVVTDNFKSKYDEIEWINDEVDFKKWCDGKTGYPMVDAGMRQLNETGYMHNRVRMITAGFLCKHLLIDWRLGEVYFAKKLLDFELSSNNGNWQWAAGTGCDSAPYFRIFNPMEQKKKFDKDENYIKKWIPEYGTSAYPSPIVEHKFARQRALETYKKGLNAY